MDKTKIVDKIGDILAIAGIATSVIDLLIIVIVRPLLKPSDMRLCFIVAVWSITAIIIGLILFVIAGKFDKN